MNSNQLTITAIPAFNDNYIWALTKRNKLALVDPGDAQVCIRFIEQHQFQLSDILITHHHRDHTGGLEQLVAYCELNNWPCNVYGPSNEKINLVSAKVDEGDTITVLNDFPLSVLSVYGHTAGHIAFYNADISPVNFAQSNSILFCGDTLFSGGCGRIFEGTAAQLFHSLQKINQLPSNTLIYCAHEYTESNLRFATSIEPNNRDLKTYYEQVLTKRSNKLPTIPTTLEVERKINPFLRCHLSSIQQPISKLAQSNILNAVDVFTELRRLKDNA